MMDATDDDLAQAMYRAKIWLRMNGDYDIKIDLWGPYGLTYVQGFYLGNVIAESKGRTVGKHLHRVLESMMVYRKDKASRDAEAYQNAKA